ncbi:MAG: hypothetical protein IH786_10390 [Proteobacteria bacterium]|nr:hypothetical protein [Pseudomonadota bacterium]
MEPNSGLGQAIAYLLRHWEKLTLFLHKPVNAAIDATNDVIRKQLDARTLADLMKK